MNNVNSREMTCMEKFCINQDLVYEEEPQIRRVAGSHPKREWIRRKPGVKVYIVRFQRIEAGMRGHWLFSAFTAVYVFSKLADIGPAVLLLVVPPLLVSITGLIRRGELRRYFTAGAAVALLNIWMIMVILRIFAGVPEIFIMGPLCGLMILPAAIYRYLCDIGGR